MKNFKTSVLILFSLCICNIINANKDNNVYIVYLGEKKHDDPQHVVESHYDLLSTVVGSKEEASTLMVHNYKYGFSGFTATLTEEQAVQLAASPDVVRVTKDHAYKPQGTIIASEYFGLTPQLPTNIAQRTNQGEDVIIGVIDTGIWANNTAGFFSDEGYGPIPARWKGTCTPGKDFDPAVQCNKKVIGAYWFRRGAIAAANFNSNDTVEHDISSPLDAHGHGTHCASTAAGSEVKNVTLANKTYGTFRGIAPRARIAVYKACYNIRRWGVPETDDCLASDVIHAFDQAIHDGVDVISASIGPQHNHGDDLDNYLNWASFHAVSAGISVVAAAGNMGPGKSTLGNTSPWHLTVAAARVNTEVVAPVTLGNNMTLFSVPLSGTEGLGFKKIVLMDNSVISKNSWNIPRDKADLVNGSVVFLHQYSWRNEPYDQEFRKAKDVFSNAKGLGVVAIMIDVDSTNTISYEFEDYNQKIFCVEQDVKKQIVDYIRSTPNPVVDLGKPYIREGPEVKTLIEYYSSRGPSRRTPLIVKPDIAAPAWGLLGAKTGFGQGPNPNPFMAMKGTSSATPVVAGLVALLKAEHRDWSPAAIKSAFVTTGSLGDIYGAPIISPWSKGGLAGPHDFGGGMANVQAATNPGLVYDMIPNDYVLYLCACGYPIVHIRHIAQDQSLNCPRVRPSIMDVNLPSIGIGGLRETTKLVVKRTVTNVGPEISTYKPQIIAPFGTKITVRPKKLKFNPLRKQITYKLTIQSIGPFENQTDGSITWVDGVHRVRSPIVILS